MANLRLFSRNLLHCHSGVELVELLRSFVYLRPLDKEAFVPVSGHSQMVLYKDDENFASGILALVKAKVKLEGKFPHIGDGTLYKVLAKLREGPKSSELVEAVALLASTDVGKPHHSTHKDGTPFIYFHTSTAELRMGGQGGGLRSSLVRLLSSPDGAVRRNAIAALRNPTR